MTSIVNGCVNIVRSFIPVAGSIDRKILYLWTFSEFLHERERFRYEATIASLVLKGTPYQKDRDFVQLITGRDDPDLSKIDAKSELFASNSADDICKVIAAACFIVTRDASLHASITHLLSHSERVSKIAKPLLDKAVSLPIPRCLQSTRMVWVIAFTPFIIKQVQGFLILFDPKGENRIAEALKKGADKTSQALEFLWHLRFSIICLGLSKSFYPTIASAVFNKALDVFLCYHPDYPHVPKLLKALRLSTFFIKSFDKDVSKRGLVQDLLRGYDLWPTTGFQMGIDGMCESWFSSSAPYDLDLLEELFREVGGVKSIVDDVELLNRVKIVRDKIINAAAGGKLNAAKGGKISSSHLYKLVHLMQRSIEGRPVAISIKERSADDRNIQLISVKVTSTCQTLH